MLTIVLVVLATVVAMTISYALSGFLYFPLIMMVVISYGLFKLLLWIWAEESRDDERRKNEVDIEVARLEERLQNRRATLLNLERQVADIIDLFEVAKHFNQCLTIEEVVDILHTNVFDHLKAQSSVLILFDSARTAESAYRAYCLNTDGESFVYDTETEENPDNEKRKRLDRFVTVAIEHSEVIRIDYPIQFNDFFDGDPRTEMFPLWIFPLVVENKLIASYIVEGAVMNDFSKFAIIAAQLALQIKKIRLYEDVRELSITDGLTKVFLRRHFLERFEGELKRTIKYDLSLCVLMLDIDHFKEYNDNYGHLVGDVTLKEVAQVITDSVRRVDLVGRYGGEEFIIVLPETGKEGGLDAAERIRSAAARKRLKVYDEETKITVSIGVASFPNDFKKYSVFSPDIMDALIQKADECLYRAKEDGRNRIIST